MSQRSLPATLLGVALLLLAGSHAIAQQHNAFDESVAPFLQRYCFGCHAGEEPEGEARLDLLKPEFADAAQAKLWLLALDKATTGEMPPRAAGKEHPRPDAKEIRAFGMWISRRAAVRRAAEGRVVLRRLNRIEYENTMRDLLAIRSDLKELLPLDSSAYGFDNVGEALHVSSFLMERYLEAADVALNLAIVNTPQPPLVKKRYLLGDERQVKAMSEPVYLNRDDATVLFSASPWSAVNLWQFYPPDRGTYRFRVSAFAVQSNEKPVTFRVDAGPMLMGTKNHLVGYFDAPPNTAKLIEFTDHLEARNHIRISPYDIGTAFDVTKAGGAEKYEGPGLAIEYVEIEGPLHEQWPPESHRRIFGDLPQERVGNRLEVVSKDPQADAARILGSFAERAVRRPVQEEELRPFLELVSERLAEQYSFEQAMRVGLKGILVSPGFLFLHEPPGQLNDFALASRLSYFLWSSLPDEQLLELARNNKLHQRDILREQVERMLNDAKATAFVHNFTDQWLQLRDIDFTAPDRLLYPEFDDLLKVSMVDETRLFFAEVLKEDLSLTNFVASDFSMLNARLAKHYHIDGVEGWELRKVALPPESHRGGLLTMASVLKVTANGTTTSPVVRGAWVLDRILGQPPAPPPAGVPAIEPDIRGATTIREQLAKHRQVESCATCHVKIDPPGFALESFDVIGGWRDNYRTLGNGKAVTIDGKPMHYRHGVAVDCADELPDGRSFANVDEYKKLLLADPDQLARSLATKLVTYGTGHPPEAEDRAQIEALVVKSREQKYGFRSLVHEVVQSPLFQHK